MFMLIELILWFLVILVSVLLVMATRRIPVQYARSSASGGYEKNIAGSRQYIPLKAECIRCDAYHIRPGYYVCTQDCWDVLLTVRPLVNGWRFSSRIFLVWLITYYSLY